MNAESPTIGVVACAAGGVEHLRERLVIPLLEGGYRVGVTLTPPAAVWLAESGEVQRLEDVTGLPVRSTPRLPGQARPHPPVDAYVVAPATANTVAKLALGISDNQALTQINESMAVVPVVVFPRVNAAHARHPAWEGHLAALRRAGVRLVYGDDVWPLYEPREAPADRSLPWPVILEAVTAAIPG